MPAPSPLLIAAIGYLLALVAVGLWKMKNVTTHSDFAVGGRSFSTWVLTGTLLATWIGTGSLFGNSEKTVEIGLAAWILPLGGVLGMILLIPIAPRARRFEGFTVQDILEARYSPAARVLGTITLVIAYVTIVSYQMRAGGAVLHLLAPDLSLGTATIVAAAFVITYTMLAGIVSVAYTDVVNGIVMTIGFLLLLPVLWNRAGGLEGIATTLPEDHLSFLGPLSLGDVIALTLPALLLVLGDANMYQRFFSARSERAAKRAVLWLVPAALVLELAIIGCAWLGSSLATDLANPGHVLAVVARDFVPTALGAILLATMVAVIVSTADSYLLVPATCVVRDLWQRFFAKEATERELLFASRVAVLLLGLTAYALTYASDEFLAVALYAYTIYGAGITPSLLAAFLWPRATATGAVLSIASGIIVTIVWETWGAGILPGVETVYPAITISVLALVGGSLATSRP